MPKRTRRTHSPAFKAKVAFAALRGDLKTMTIDRPGRAYAADITYIPMERCAMYLTAVIESRL